MINFHFKQNYNALERVATNKQIELDKFLKERKLLLGRRSS